VEALQLGKVTGPTAGVGEPILLDAERCVSCGLCLHLCPTDVFAQSRVPEIKLLDAFEGIPPDRPAELTCPRNEHPQRSRVEGATVVQTPRCLAALTVPLLLALRRRVALLWLNDVICADCPIGRAQPYIAHTGEAVNALLTAFGHSPAVRTYKAHPEELAIAPTETQVYSGQEPTYTRRGFFTSLGRLTRQATVNVIAESMAAREPQGPVPVEQRLPHRVPKNRRQLLLGVRALGDPLEVPFALSVLSAADVAVDGEACSACGLCARFCPTGALKFAADESHFVLRFVMAACVDCTICALICPDDAVSFTYESPISALVETEPSILLAGNLVPCARCSQPVAGEPEEDVTCYVCRSPRPQEALSRGLPTRVT